MTTKTLIYLLITLSTVCESYAQNYKQASSENSIITLENTKQINQRNVARHSRSDHHLGKKSYQRPHNIWLDLIFGFGGILCMYLVGRHIFQEQSNELKTLIKFRDQIGYFYTEFDPVNISKWVEITADHLYISWRTGYWDTMMSFTTEYFIKQQEDESAQIKSEGLRREAYLGKVLKVHLLGAYMQDGYDIPPLGVELICRIELRVIDFKKKIYDPDVTIGDKNGADSDIYDFIGDWRYSQRGIGRHCG